VKPATDATMENPRWRGVNHLALVTPDMDATVRFYHGVLGMRLVATVMAGPMRHYFFEIGPENTVAFFEVKGAEAFTAPAGIPDRLRKAQFDHLSFNVADEDGLIELQERLRKFDCEVTPIVDHGFVRSIYFNDPHGIALEASWWAVDATSRPADFSDARLFADPNPVNAVTELQSTGRLTSTPTTTLAGDEVADPV
jgi:catechol 2,3-dioxygenase-like lactoylglutathione lyase family enzyme